MKENASQSCIIMRIYDDATNKANWMTVRILIENDLW